MIRYCDEACVILSNIDASDRRGCQLSHDFHIHDPCVSITEVIKPDMQIG